LSMQELEALTVLHDERHLHLVASTLDDLGVGDHHLLDELGVGVDAQLLREEALFHVRQVTVRLSLLRNREVVGLRCGADPGALLQRLEVVGGVRQPHGDAEHDDAERHDHDRGLHAISSSPLRWRASPRTRRPARSCRRPRLLSTAAFASRAVRSSRWSRIRGTLARTRAGPPRIYRIATPHPPWSHGTACTTSSRAYVRPRSPPGCLRPGWPPSCEAWGAASRPTAGSSSARPRPRRQRVRRRRPRTES